MTRFSGLFLLCTILLLPGCAEKWVKPGATPAQFDAMQSACISQASARFPPLIREVPINDGYMTPTTTSCARGDRSVSCTQRGGQYVAPDVVTVDDNQPGRNNDIRACFYANGWQPAAE